MADDSTRILEGLSATQMRLLRLVAQGVTSSKALAQETGLQPASIDTYLQGAARLLGCSGRSAAAARLAELETETSQSASQLRRKRLAVRLKIAVSRAARTVWRFFAGPPLGGGLHALSPAEVGLQILRIGIIGIVSLTVLVLLLLGVLRTFR